MGFSSGMQDRRVPVKASGPASGTRAATAATPVAAGGTNATTVQEARENLDVPSLSGNNIFTGVNTLLGVVSLGATLAANDGINVQGAFVSEETSSLGGVSVAYVAKTADYPLATTDTVVNATSGTWTATLPTAVGAAGKLYVVNNSGAGTITLATTSSQTIDGGAPGTVAAGAVIRLVSDGANWISI